MLTVKGDLERGTLHEMLVWHEWVVRLHLIGIRTGIRFDGAAPNVW
ncbi:hypothetical protein BAC2_01748 [uncultured bacterium]|nr:hypothetical protein BAC2_01748 [uncultured bacterium]